MAVLTGTLALNTSQVSHVQMVEASYQPVFGFAMGGTLSPDTNFAGGGTIVVPNPYPSTGVAYPFMGWLDQ